MRLVVVCRDFRGVIENSVLAPIYWPTGSVCLKFLHFIRLTYPED